MELLDLHLLWLLIGVSSYRILLQLHNELQLLLKLGIIVLLPTGAKLSGTGTALVI